MPKDWAKGLTAATDQRVARAAAAHRGMAYRPRMIHRRAALDWTPAFAYAVGLLATDGCLVTGRKRVDFVSADRELVESLLACLQRPARIRECAGREERTYFRVQICDAALYRRLLEIGLTPRKSLTLGALAVPDHLLRDTVRGLLDGDGSIACFTHAPTRRLAPGYLYERLWVFFHSASRAHLEWLVSSVQATAAIGGRVELHRAARDGTPDCFRAKYGDVASRALLGWLYADASAPRLARKLATWEGYAARRAVRKEGLEPSRPFEQ